MESMTDKDILYLGCAKGVYGHGDGHFCYLCGEHNGRKYMEFKGVDFADSLHPAFRKGELDGEFCPQETTQAFKAKVTRIDCNNQHERRHEGFTVLSFWDYSGDSRPGSNSTFVMRGYHRFPQMIITLQDAVPDLFKRFGQNVEMFELEERDSNANS